MKKIALTSLLAVVATGAAHASVHVMDGNPLYMPRAGHFYSETSLASSTDNAENWKLGESFGVGIIDRLAINMRTSLAEEGSFDVFGFQDFSLGATFRIIGRGNWRLDVLGSYNVDGWLYAYDEATDDTAFMDKDMLNYTWRAGVRGGYTNARFTVAGHLMLDYENKESFNWGEDGFHRVALGVDGQLLITRDWNFVGGLEYSGLVDEGAKNTGELKGYFGANYNITPSSYVGAYVSGEMSHESGAWKWQNGMGFGVKFGVDF